MKSAVVLNVPLALPTAVPSRLKASEIVHRHQKGGRRKDVVKTAVTFSLKASLLADTACLLSHNYRMDFRDHISAFFFGRMRMRLAAGDGRLLRQAPLQYLFSSCRTDITKRELYT